jgi:hypothetical protein
MAQGLKPRIYNIDGGMSKHLCALRVAAREPAAQGMIFFVLLRHG